MAKSLRQILTERGVEVTHSEALEIIAKQFGFENWNVMAAQIEPHDPSPLVVPEGWVKSGNRIDQYRMGIDAKRPGSPAIIECRYDADSPTFAPNGFATLMQAIDARKYRGGNVMLSAELKTEGVSGAGTIWMRIDRAPGQILRFDNMENRETNGALKGDTDWIERSIILEVPDEAASINFGFFTRGLGRTLARNFKLASTERKPTRDSLILKDEPTNLDFQIPGHHDANQTGTLL
jgi:hypothetical protein